MNRKSIANTAPYDLFHDDKERREFQRRCLQCKLRNPDKHGMPQCDVFYYLLQSILDRTVRWEHEWVELGKEGPVCVLYTPEQPQK